MKKYLIAITLTFSTLFSMSQDKDPVIHITGFSEVFVEPDQATVSMMVRLNRSSYAPALSELSERIGTLHKELTKIDFEDDDIKSEQFNISINYVYEKGERREDGYNAHQTLTVKFPLENKRLIQVLNCAANSESKPELSIAFGLKAETMAIVKDDLLKKAVADARRKAELIAGELNQEISGIQEISYGAKPNEYSPINMMNSRLMETADVEMSSMNPEDLQYNDSVNIIFKLSSKK